jgi:hypothetical protein
VLLPSPAQVTNQAPPLQYPAGGSWISPFGQANAAATPVVGTVYACGFVVPSAISCIGLGIQLQNAPSSDAVVRVGIYSQVAARYLPSSVLCDSGDISTGASSGAKSAAIAATTIPAGLVFAAYCFTTATSLTNAVSTGLGSGAGGPSMLLPAQGFVYYGVASTPTVALGNDGTVFTQTGVAAGGARPAPFAGSWVGNSNTPSRPATIYLRVA